MPIIGFDLSRHCIEDPADRDEMFHLYRLEAGLAGMRIGEAAGLSGIPAEMKPPLLKGALARRERAEACHGDSLGLSFLAVEILREAVPDGFDPRRAERLLAAAGFGDDGIQALRRLPGGSGETFSLMQQALRLICHAACMEILRSFGTDSAHELLESALSG